MKTRAKRALTDDPLLHKVWEQLGRPPDCRVTGGYVRDRLLGRPSNDLDLTIVGDVDEAARPAKRLARALGTRAHLLGISPNQIWRVATPVLKIELWPLGDLSHEDDIRRRDFTCNALSWELPDGPLVDLVGGLVDLGSGRLRAISRANLENDPVRMLRAPRFLAQLTDFNLDDRTRSWIEGLAPSLAEAPRERVGQELAKLLRGPMAARGLRKCLALKLLGPASPAADRIDTRWLTANLDAADTLTIARRAGVSPSGGPSTDIQDSVRLAFLFRAWGLPTDRAVAPYAWPKRVREHGLRAARLLDNALSKVNAPAAERRELAWRAGTAFPALIALAIACEPDRPGWRRWLRQWERDPETLLDPRPFLSGNEIAELTGIEPGPELGAVADALLRAQVRSEVRTRGGAVRWLGRCR